MFKKIGHFILEMNCVSDYYTLSMLNFLFFKADLLHSFSPQLFILKNCKPTEKLEEDILNTRVLLHRFTSY